jgi:hypothetical protein
MDQRYRRVGRGIKLSQRYTEKSFASRYFVAKKMPRFCI